MAVLVELPEALRGELKEPLGPVYTDSQDLLADATEPVVTVGDIVTYHLLGADYRPAVAVVDGRSQRERIDRTVGDVLDFGVDTGAIDREGGDGGDGGGGGGGDGDGGGGGGGDGDGGGGGGGGGDGDGEGGGGGDPWFDDVLEVENPAATLTADLLGALRTALGQPGSTVVVVDGEEDLATLPAVLAAPEGASVVYGQPDEGMVLVVADEASRQRVRDLLGRMAGDHDALWRALGVEEGS